MNLFRKFRFVIVALLLASFMVYSGFVMQGLNRTEPAGYHGNIRFDITHGFSADCLLPNFVRTHPNSTPAVFKCFPDRVSFAEPVQRATASSTPFLPALVSSNVYSVSLDLICKLQI